MRGTGSGLSFLSRLARDARGNTLALVAAAMMPLAGLIGGGVDMSRLYLVKTRLQQACDAGALAGRKAMAAGAWSTGAGSSEAKAESMFGSNFGSGNYGTTGLITDYEELDGTVTGSVFVTVPMTIMRIFGMADRQLHVNCTAKMEIPNTDVMFVLDTTGSMAGSKITGLRSAVKCFYEALERVNTAEVCGNDPVATTYSGSAQIRIGFVPYAENVNVGRLLPPAYMADTWTYQSRVARTQTAHAWTYGATSTSTGWSAWSTNVPSTSTLRNSGSYSNWATVSGSGSVTINGTSWSKTPSKTSTTCPQLNPYNGNDTLDYVDTGVVQTATVKTNDPSTTAPVWPATSLTTTYNDQSDSHVVAGYRYRWDSSTSKCRLQSGTYSYSLTRSGGQAATPVTWTDYQVFQDWAYQPVTFSVSPLKTGIAATPWAASIPLLTGKANGPKVKLSGTTAQTTLVLPSNQTINWDGCIEERHTFQNTDGVPSDDWNPVPAAALDMDINLLPNNNTTYADAWWPQPSHWGPMLGNATWGRFTPSGSCGNSGNTVNTVYTTCDEAKNNSYECPTAGRKLTEYTTPTSLVSYVDSLAVSGNTYHDIGMLWGARLLSPTGIFGSENDYTPSGRPIQRHLIFMTDGDTVTTAANYTSQGMPYWDRRQFNSQPTDNQVKDLANARLVALCTAVKNMNITLWVISYGGGITTETGGRLNQCATPGHYYSASNGPALIAQFRQIASEISELRLTS